MDSKTFNIHGIDFHCKRWEEQKRCSHTVYFSFGTTDLVNVIGKVNGEQFQDIKYIHIWSMPNFDEDVFCHPPRDREFFPEAFRPVFDWAMELVK